MRETLYGRNSIYESLRAGRREFFRLRIADTIHSGDITNSILTLAKSRKVPVESISRHILDSLGGVNHQGIVLDAGPYPYTDLEDILISSRESQTPPLVLVLDLVQDPQNLGTLLRTAEAVGVHGIVIQERRAASITPAVTRTSAGAVEHLAVARVTNVAQTITTLKANNIWVAGLEKVPDAQDYTQANLTGPLAVVVGSEGNGLRRLVRERCDFLIDLPMAGKVTSLNAAVAGSVVLYEVLRQRKQHIRDR